MLQRPVGHGEVTVKTWFFLLFLPSQKNAWAKLFSYQQRFHAKVASIMNEFSPDDLSLLNASSLVLLGFGAQGEAEAVNLKRSGVKFELGLREGGSSWNKAREAGFDPKPIEVAARLGTTWVMNLPDQTQKSVYEELRAKNLKPTGLVFAHGFNTHFKLIPVTADGPAHLLVAPKGAASGLKEFYQTPNALPAILAVEGSKNHEADLHFARAYARAIGCHPQALIEANFKDETVCDLFAEQALLCGGVSSLLRTTYEVLVEKGYHPEAAYFETLFELKLIVDLIWKDGITGMRNRISPTARYGDVTRGSRVIDASVKKRMIEVLREVESGAFATEFLQKLDAPEYRAQLQTESQHSLETIGRDLRARMRKSS